MQPLYDDALIKISFYLTTTELSRWRITCKDLSENIPLCEEMAARVDWWLVSNNKTTTEVSLSFIGKFVDYIDWTMLCITRKLPEIFIRKNKCRVDWAAIFIYQDVTRDLREMARARLNLN
nr:hypothetical protein K-LCC10_0155 [Kaumoebavirus]